MTQTQKNPHKLIHVGIITGDQGRKQYVFLRKIEERRFGWFEETPDHAEKEASLYAETIEEALRLANRKWKQDHFNTLGCGFRYTLPERDEHGMNALFYQMAASYSSMNGIYYDEELGNNCFVQNASIEARELFKYLSQHAAC